MWKQKDLKLAWLLVTLGTPLFIYKLAELKTGF